MRRPRLITLGIVAVLLGFAAATTFAITGYVHFSRTVNRLQRVDVPGHRSITLDHAGNYIVYLESREPSDAPSRQVTMTVTGPDGTALELRPADDGDNTVYQLDSHNGETFGSVTANQPGTYQLTTAGENNVTVAVGDNVKTTIAHMVMPAVLSLLAGLGLGIPLIIISRLGQYGYPRRAGIPSTPAPAD